MLSSQSSGGISLDSQISLWGPLYVGGLDTEQCHSCRIVVISVNISEIDRPCLVSKTNSNSFFPSLTFYYGSTIHKTLLGAMRRIKGAASILVWWLVSNIEDVVYTQNNHDARQNVRKVQNTHLWESG